MPHFNTAAVGALTAALLAGCSSSSSSTTTPTPNPVPDYISFLDIEADAVPLLAEYDGDPAAADIPDSSSATYDGFISLPLVDGDLIGQLEMVVTFGALDGTVVSTADGFFHENNGAYTGEISGVGTLTKSPAVGQPQVASTLIGTLSNGGIDYNTGVSLAGDIMSDSVDPDGAMAGTADATVGASGLIFGAFATER